MGFRFYTQEYAALVSNTVASDTDPDGAGRSPLALWPRMPWKHADMKLPPYGCRAYLHLTDPSDKMKGPRAYAGVFIRLSKFSASYILYDHETSKTHEGSNMRLDEHISRSSTCCAREMCTPRTRPWTWMPGARLRCSRSTRRRTRS